MHIISCYKLHKTLTKFSNGKKEDDQKKTRWYLANDSSNINRGMYAE